MVGDYISREAAIKALSHGDGCGHVCKHSIERIPAADVVAVVRCGECKHYNDKLEMYSDRVCTIRHYCDGSPIIVGKDDFCSSGNRKDGGQDNG